MTYAPETSFSLRLVEPAAGAEQNGSILLPLGAKDILVTSSLRAERENTEHRTALCLGAPVLGERIAHQEIARRAAESDLDRSFLSSINGAFLLVIAETSGRLTLINDRFTAYPLYHALTRSGLVAAENYALPRQALAAENAISPTPEAYYELIYLRRLLGEKTLDADVRFLPPASVLRYDLQEPETVRIETYWTPNYDKDQSLTPQRGGEALAGSVARSIARKTTDEKRYGLFLSGGLDTRLCLAGFQEPPVCFTASASTQGNREYETAARLAGIAGARHIHLPMDGAHYERAFTRSLDITGGLYTNIGLFAGFKDLVRPEIDVAFHGHGFDYMFQGMYVHARYVRPLGLPLCARVMRDHGPDLADEFISGVSYRIKDPEFDRFLRPERREPLRASLRASVDEILDRARSLSDNPRDQWEYLTFHALSRHYSYPDHASINTCAEQRAVSFDNDLYDLYLRLPHASRFDGRTQRAAIARLSPALAAVPSANDGLPLASSWVKSCHQLGHFARIALGMTKRNTLPDHLLRTWPSNSWLFKNIPFFADGLARLPDSPYLDLLDWLDRDHLRSAVARVQAGEDWKTLRYLGDSLWGFFYVDATLRREDTGPRDEPAPATWDTKG